MYEVPAVPEREMCKSAMHIFLHLTAHLRAVIFILKVCAYFTSKRIKCLYLEGLGLFWAFFCCFSFFSYIVNFFILYSGASAVRII